MGFLTKEQEEKLKNFKLPWISKVWKKYISKALRYSIAPAFLIALVFGIIYNESAREYNWMWWIVKGIGFFFIFGFGVFGLIGHQAERIKANKLRKELGLTHEEFMMLVKKYQITGM
jgi:hypothetical protein